MKTNSYKADWLNKQFEILRETGKISKPLAQAIRTYLLSSYYLNETINGSGFTYLYNDVKCQILSIIPDTLGNFTLQSRKLQMTDFWKNKFSHRGLNRKIIYVKVKFSWNDKDGICSSNTTYELFLSRKKFTRFLWEYYINLK